MFSGLAARAFALGIVVCVASCAEATAPVPGPPGAVDLDVLFAPATAIEIAAVRADWAARNPRAEDVGVVETLPMTLGGAQATLQVLEHRVDGARHYGAMAVPDGAAPRSLPVLLYAHGGDGGVDLGDLQLLSVGLGDLASRVVLLAPSFRSEELRTGSSSWLSEGPPSPWDRDVDDALALLEAAVQVAPAIDPARVVVVGLSRGAGVGLLMAVRDPRIVGVVEFFGPTDFFGGYTRDIVDELLGGTVRDLPGLTFLNERFIAPLSAGDLSTDEVRLELVRRSAVLFAPDLPAIQIHHGTEDAVVAVSQAMSLMSALQGRGPDAPPVEAFLYPGGTHDPLSLPGSFERARSFVVQLAGLE